MAKLTGNCGVGSICFSTSWWWLFTSTSQWRYEWIYYKVLQCSFFFTNYNKLSPDLLPFQLLLRGVALSRLLLPSSSRHLSSERLRAFMKKLATVVTSSPSCWAIVACISFDGRFVSLNIACKVLRWMSVKTRRGFFGDRLSGVGCCSCSFLLQAVKRQVYRCKHK